MQPLPVPPERHPSPGYSKGRGLHILSEIAAVLAEIETHIAAYILLRSVVFPEALRSFTN